jgi:hypothetical protein
MNDYGGHSRSFVTGHDFSRAEDVGKSMRALAPEGMQITATVSLRKRLGRFK